MAADEAPVLVTGFGPFGHHLINASWEAVKELQRLGVEYKSRQIALKTKEIPVVYEDVSERVPILHKELKPQLCIHVGVSSHTEVMQLERCGHNKGYEREDIYGNTPQSGYCIVGGPDIIDCKFNVGKVCQKLSQKQSAVKVAVSENAGHYLCDFIYYMSLHISQVPVLFVHIPELGSPYSVTELAYALRDLIEILLEEIESS